MQRKTTYLDRSNKLSLNQETIRVLPDRALRAVAAGGTSFPDTTVLTTQP